MPVIPPWLNIDPIAPARIALEASTRRAANAQAERRAQIEEQRIFAQQQAMYDRIAAQERASQRHDEVYRQTRDAQIAQQAAAMEYRRAIADQQNARQMQALRLRESQVEQQASAASRKLFGMRNLQEAVKSGMPLEQALAENAADLFADRPERAASAIKAAREPGAPVPFTTPGGAQGVYNPLTGAPSFSPRLPNELGPEAYTAKNVVDELGQPIGFKAIPGKGAARLLPSHENLTPELEMRKLFAQIQLAQKKSLLGLTLEERQQASKRLAELEKKLEAFGTKPAAPTQRVPGKLDESIPPEEEGGAPTEQDFLLPPTGQDEEAQMSQGDTGEETVPTDEDLAAQE